jgi:glycerol-3-phosphate acyltransferase PlsY
MGEVDTIAVVLIVVGYVVGSVPLANSVARRRGAPDLRDVGDRNPGFWNSRSVLTSRDSTVVFIGDLAKGAIPASLALAFTTSWVVAYLAGLAAMIGHAWPLFAGFRGGRSVLTWVGATLVVAPLPATFAVVLLAVVWVVTRKFPLAVKVAVITFPFFQFVIEDPWHTAMSGVLMTFVGLRFLTAARRN